MELAEKKDMVKNFLDKKQRETYFQKLERMSEAELINELNAVALEEKQATETQ